MSLRKREDPTCGRLEASWLPASALPEAGMTSDIDKKV
jgi:hypothetical protein